MIEIGETLAHDHFGYDLIRYPNQKIHFVHPDGYKAQVRMLVAMRENEDGSPFGVAYFNIDGKTSKDLVQLFFDYVKERRGPIKTD